MSNHGVGVVSAQTEETIVPSALARSVQARLNQLGRNPFEAARKGGLERSFINDILIGRKKSVRGDNIGRLATALDWTVADLMVRIEGNPSTELRRRRVAEGKTLRELAEAASVDIDKLERAEYEFAEDGSAWLGEDEYRRVADVLRRPAGGYRSDRQAGTGAAVGNRLRPAGVADVRRVRESWTKGKPSNEPRPSAASSVRVAVRSSRTRSSQGPRARPCSISNSVILAVSASATR